MSERVATRSVLLELREERSSMREGFTFLDEKCLLLAGSMLRELTRFESLWPSISGRSERPSSGLGTGIPQ